MKKFLMLFTLILAFCCFAGCSKDGNADWKERDTIRIGSSGPLSGEVSVYGTTVKKGVDLAIKEINAAGGVKVGDTKRLIEVVGFIDDEHIADKAKAAFNTLYDKSLDVYVGAVTSAPTEAAISEAIKTGIPLITPTATADSITVGSDGTERDNRSSVFRACFNDSYQGEVIAKFSKDQGYKKVAVLYNNTDAYSTGLFDAFKETVTSENLGITVDGFGYQSSTSDFSSYFQGQITDVKYDAVYVPDYYQTVAKIITSGRQNNYTKAFLGCDGWDGIDSMKDFTVSYLENTYFSNHFAVDATDAKVKTFVDAYKKEYGVNPTALAVLGYDAIYIMKQAIENAGTLKYSDVVKALSSSDFVAQCVTGNITYDENGNPRKAAAIMTFDANGAIKFFKTQQ